MDVLYAGSLVELVEDQVGPAFHGATGYSVRGFGAGSDALATQIKGKVRLADVFISASPSVNASLEGPGNGDWVTWYVTFARAPLVLGYSPSSRFAEQLRTRPWYDVVTEPGFLLGRTDPVTDPKGELAVEALERVAAAHGLPGLRALAGSNAGVYPEETLIGRLQAGQLDAGFFYSSEAKTASLATVPLTGVSLSATYTVTVVNRAPDESGAVSFVAYLLGPGVSWLRKDGFQVISPALITGTGVPSALSSSGSSR